MSGRLRIADCGLRIGGATPGRGRASACEIRNPKSKIQNCPSAGFTLLEVILALVILAAALAMIGEVMEMATRHAVEARAETQAQSLAASVMDQIISGAIEATGATRQPLEVDDATRWLYSITIGKSSLTGIMPVEVLVEQDIEARLGPVKYRLFRWLPTAPESPETSSPGAAGGAGPGGAGSGAPGGASSGQAPGGAGAPPL